MVGLNAAQLDLGSAYSCLYPVFNVSLLTPYVDPASAGRSPAAVPSLTDTTAVPPLPDWRHVAGILNFQVRGRHSLKYLLCWTNSTPLDDTWVPLHDIPYDLDSYLLGFHQHYPSFLTKAFAPISWAIRLLYCYAGLSHLSFVSLFALKANYYCNVLEML